MRDRSAKSEGLADADSVLIGAGELEPDPTRAAKLYQELADDNDAIALLRCAVCAAEGLGRSKDWPQALDYLSRSAELGLESSQRQLELLCGRARDSGSSWSDVRARIDLDGLLSPPSREFLSNVSMVSVVREFAPPGFAQWLIHLARDRLARARVQLFANGDAVYDNRRTASTAPLGPLERDLICSVMQERTARLTGLGIRHQEPPTVLHYEVGQFFAPHYDYLPPELIESDERIRGLGQRWATVLTYLNDDFFGAETHFPKLGIKFRGRTGDALAFSNVLADGSPDANTLHEGLPPQAGQKWILSQWVRSRPMLLS